MFTGEAQEYKNSGVLLFTGEAQEYTNSGGLLFTGEAQKYTSLQETEGHSGQPRQTLLHFL